MKLFTHCSQAGQTLLGLIIGLAAAIGVGLLSTNIIGQLSHSTHKTELSATLAELRRRMMSHLNNEGAVANTIQSAANANMQCLRAASSCPELPLNGGAFDLLDSGSSARMVFAGAVNEGTQYYTNGGGNCSKAAYEAADGECSIALKLSWAGICPGTLTSCKGPALSFSGVFSLRLKGANAAQLVNAAVYNFELQQHLKVSAENLQEEACKATGGTYNAATGDCASPSVSVVNAGLSANAANGAANNAGNNTGNTAAAVLAQDDSAYDAGYYAAASSDGAPANALYKVYDQDTGRLAGYITPDGNAYQRGFDGVTRLTGVGSCVGANCDITQIDAPGSYGNDPGVKWRLENGQTWTNENMTEAQRNNTYNVQEAQGESVPIGGIPIAGVASAQELVAQQQAAAAPPEPPPPAPEPPPPPPPEPEWWQMSYWNDWAWW